MGKASETMGDSGKTTGKSGKHRGKTWKVRKMNGTYWQEVGGPRETQKNPGNVWEK